MPWTSVVCVCLASIRHLLLPFYPMWIWRVCLSEGLTRLWLHELRQLLGQEIFKPFFCCSQRLVQRVNRGLKQEQSESPDEIPAQEMSLPLISAYTDQLSLAVPMAVFNNRTHRTCLRLMPGILLRPYTELFCGQFYTWTSWLNCSVAQSRPTLCSPRSSPPGSSVHGIFQARILEWVAISSRKGSSQPRD